jgi:hypothetical protein
LGTRERSLSWDEDEGIRINAGTIMGEGAKGKEISGKG